MSWQTYKRSKLSAYEKARGKNEVDEGIVDLIEKINKNPDLVSLSSCSGRIVLLMVDEQGKKNASFFAKWHEPVEPEEFEMKLTQYTSSMPLWFRVEPFILHVAAKDLESAKKFMEKIRAVGVKRGGIQVIKEDKILMEFQGSGYIAMPVDPIREWNDLIQKADEIMKKNFKILKRLENVKW
jgi:tRNA wybutosine-synthesizing protein 3